NATRQTEAVTATCAAIVAGKGRECMKTLCRTAIAATFASVLLGMCFVSKASAQCGSLLSSNLESIQPQLLEGQSLFMPASFAERRSESDKIVGFWRAKFISQGSSGIPDGTVVDYPFVEWHEDGTEIMNSTRAPATQSFCMGVWHKTGNSSYELNHFALSFDTSNNFVGPAQIHEDVTVDKKADQYTGTFKIDQYDPSGNVLAEVVGQITAIRITVNTTINQVL
ncbi:MAG: hypothetical protein ACREQR_04025, partial [Candidatus Binataceae bacterium]